GALRAHRAGGRLGLRRVRPAGGRAAAQAGVRPAAALRRRPRRGGRAGRAAAHRALRRGAARGPAAGPPRRGPRRCKDVLCVCFTCSTGILRDVSKRKLEATKANQARKQAGGRLPPAKKVTAGGGRGRLYALLGAAAVVIAAIVVVVLVTRGG